MSAPSAAHCTSSFPQTREGTSCRELMFTHDGYFLPGRHCGVRVTKGRLRYVEGTHAMWKTACPRGVHGHSVCMSRHPSSMTRGRDAAAFVPRDASQRRITTGAFRRRIATGASRRRRRIRDPELESLWRATPQRGGASRRRRQGRAHFAGIPEPRRRAPQKTARASPFRLRWALSGGGEQTPDVSKRCRTKAVLDRGPGTTMFPAPTAARWSSLVARRAHNPKVVGSNPTRATKWSPGTNQSAPMVNTVGAFCFGGLGAMRGGFATGRGRLFTLGGGSTLEGLASGLLTKRTFSRPGTWRTACSTSMPRRPSATSSKRPLLWSTTIVTNSRTSSRLSRRK